MNILPWYISVKIFLISIFLVRTRCLQVYSKTVEFSVNVNPNAVETPLAVCLLVLWSLWEDRKKAQVLSLALKSVSQTFRVQDQSSSIVRIISDTLSQGNGGFGPATEYNISFGHCQQSELSLSRAIQ